MTKISANAQFVGGEFLGVVLSEAIRDLICAENPLSPAPTPNKLGVTVIDQVKLADVIPYIDWVCSYFYLL